MTKRMAILALCGALITAGMALASNDKVRADADVKLSSTEIANVMASAGYAMTEYEIENGAIEAEGDGDGAGWEVVIDGQTGKILSVEQDD